MSHEDGLATRWRSKLLVLVLIAGSIATIAYSFQWEIKAFIVRMVMGSVLDDIRSKAPPCIRCAGGGRVNKHPLNAIRNILGPEPETINCPLCGGSGKAPSPWD